MSDGKLVKNEISRHKRKRKEGKKKRKNLTFLPFETCTFRLIRGRNFAKSAIIFPYHLPFFVAFSTAGVVCIEKIFRVYKNYCTYGKAEDAKVFLVRTRTNIRTHTIHTRTIVTAGMSKTVAFCRLNFSRNFVRILIRVKYCVYEPKFEFVRTFFLFFSLTFSV